MTFIKTQKNPVFEKLSNEDLKNLHYENSGIKIISWIKKTPVTNMSFYQACKINKFLANKFIYFKI